MVKMPKVKEENTKIRKRMKKERSLKENILLTKELEEMRSLCNNIFNLMSNYANVQADGGSAGAAARCLGLRRRGARSRST